MNVGDTVQSVTGTECRCKTPREALPAPCSGLLIALMCKEHWAPSLPLLIDPSFLGSRRFALPQQPQFFTSCEQASPFSLPAPAFVLGDHLSPRTCLILRLPWCSSWFSDSPMGPPGAVWSSSFSGSCDPQPGTWVIFFSSPSMSVHGAHNLSQMQDFTYLAYYLWSICSKVTSEAYVKVGKGSQMP